ncbi:MAG TPA: Smr/MutS family protein [Gaiellaceae bacterium]|nr:Smr/MutS family protein [Gaiellaceae bacterium]
MDAQALHALELPAILERLATSAETEHGAAAARALTPSSDAALVAERQLLTAEAIALLDAAAEPTLAGAADARDAVVRAERGGTLQPREFRAISRSIHVTLEARRVVGESSGLAPRLHELLELVPPSLGGLAAPIDRAVEEDGSDLRDSASPLLRRLRSELRSGGARVREELTRVARSAAVRDALQETFLVERGGRPVLAVRAAERARVPGIVHDASSTGQTLFVEPFAIVELSNHLSEVSAAARDEVERILSELSSAVVAHGDGLRALAERSGAVDLALAAGTVSRGWRGAPVEVADEVRLVGARHPLLDPAQAVPIDLDLGPVRALVISGPNTGGKTVALKTLGLAALLHQSGLRPPAAEATLPVFDRVLADIGDRQSIEMSLSTFSGHIRRIVEILQAAGPRSLVLLDEVAGGTDPDEGSALARALVGRFAGQARLTVVTTHYAELKEWASSRADAVNAATGFDLETDAPLYSLALGRAGTSHALRIAERLGLDPAVVADARSVAGPERLRTSELLAEAEAAERAATGRLDELQRSLGAAQAREVELEREVAAVRDSRERARAAAIAEAESELADARAELARLRQDLRAARRHERERQREAPNAERDRDRALGRAAERAAQADRAVRRVSPPPAQLAPLGVGDPVEAPELGVRGTIAAIRGDEAEVVGATGQRLRISLDRLRPSAEPLPPPVAAPVQVRATSAGQDASDELDVRGLSGAEARERVRAFADEAALAGIATVRVVHGRGTGAVRAAVREELARHPLVDRVERDSNDGATLAHLG